MGVCGLLFRVQLSSDEEEQRCLLAQIRKRKAVVILPSRALEPLVSTTSVTRKELKFMNELLVVTITGCLEWVFTIVMPSFFSINHWVVLVP